MRTFGLIVLGFVLFPILLGLFFTATEWWDTRRYELNNRRYMKEFNLLVALRDYIVLLIKEDVIPERIEAARAAMRAVVESLPEEYDNNGMPFTPPAIP